MVPVCLGYYTILGVPPTASLDVIREAYYCRKLPSFTHPDRFGSGSAQQAWANERMKQINERMKQINEAYEILRRSREACRIRPVAHCLTRSANPPKAGPGLLVAILYFTGWLLRPFGRVLHLWMPWVLLFRIVRKR